MRITNICIRVYMRRNWKKKKNPFKGTFYFTEKQKNRSNQFPIFPKHGFCCCCSCRQKFHFPKARGMWNLSSTVKNPNNKKLKTITIISNSKLWPTPNFKSQCLGHPFFISRPRSLFILRDHHNTQTPPAPTPNPPKFPLSKNPINLF